MTMSLLREVDAVVIGAGPNGLVAANRLVDAGWDVLLLEAQPQVGGAVRSDRDLHPDFIQDTFSAFYPMAAASPAIQGLGLEDHGLRWCHAPAVLGHPRPDGSWALLHRDVDITAGLLDAHHQGDGDVWRRLYDSWSQVGPALTDALLTPFPPVRAGLLTLLKLPQVGGLSFVRQLLTPALRLFNEDFVGDGPRLLLAGNACHADIPLDAAGSGLMGLLLTMLAQTVGYPVPVGGAEKLSLAMRDRYLAHGGQVECDAPVTKVVVHRGRAVGVHCRSQLVRARRAVLADVHAERLYGELVSYNDLPSRVATRMRTFRRDPSTFKVDYALNGPVPWQSAPPYAPGTIHIANSMTKMNTFFAQLGTDTIPSHPFLLMGQMTTADPTRSPPGTESLWAYTHVPHSARTSRRGRRPDRIRGSHDEAERFADRMQARIERHAPGFENVVLSRRVLTPADLEKRNANLVGGSLNGGTAALDQQLIFRPFAGNGRATTAVPGLYLASASAHPGGRVHGACGMNAARAALAHERFRRSNLTAIVNSKVPQPDQASS